MIETTIVAGLLGLVIGILLAWRPNLRPLLILWQRQHELALQEISFERRRRIAAEEQVDVLIRMPAYGRKLVAHIDSELGISDAVRRN